MASNSRITTSALLKMKQSKSPIAMLTAYDFPTAKILDRAGVDVLLVGDSLAMVVQGNATTLPVTLDEMIYHAKMVAKAVLRAMVVVDMPFPENHLGLTHAIACAAKIMKETGAQAVKLEGGADQANVIRALVTAGIPVMAHVGLRPQNVHVMGGYKMQRDEDVLKTDAFAAQQAGAFSIVLECIQPDIAKNLTAELSIPTIGIGSGADCDGQVLVSHDLLGLTDGYVPSFVRPYADLTNSIRAAAQDWTRDVRNREFP
jgi:3-methyl-2-oxobutanoate hydroxymethyltransferase